MSEFDEEAEREKLRRQFEADEKKREASERMGDLLLQGATMTNRHCENCHSPVFTYQGRAFCPTCETEIETGDATQATAETTETPGDATDPTEGNGSLSPSGDPGPDTNEDEASGSPTPIEVGDPDDSPANRPNLTGENASLGVGSDVTTPPDPTSPDPTPPDSTSPDGDRSADAVSTPEPAHSPATDPARSADPDLAAAQASLSHTLTRLARSAERSDDLSRTREYLRAAEEAAKALAALKQARR